MNRRYALMSLDHRISALRKLQQLHLLSEQQQFEASGHTRLTDLAEQPTLHATLEWLLRAGIVDAPNLLEETRRYRRDVDVEASTARRVLVVETLRHINQQSVDALLAEALIDQSIHQIISESLMTDRALLTPAATMTLVVESHMLPWDEYRALLARPASQRSAAANAILAETAALVAQRHRDMKRAFWAEVFPGPRWMYIVGAPLMLGAAFWYVKSSIALPGCASEEARKTLNSTIMMSLMDDRNRFGGSFPLIGDFREVGFNKVRDMRGCSAQMTVEKDTRPFAYVIARDPDQPKNGFVLRGADPGIVTARFGTMAADGDFVHQAAPIGRSSLEQAFRTGTAALEEDPGNRRLASVMRSLAGKPTAAEAEEPRRDTDIEPLGACRALTPGASYTCPLLAEWDNPLMEMLGRSDRQVLRGDFTFEPNAAGAAQPWRVSANFKAEIDRAKMAGVEKKPEQEVAVAPYAK
jgi:hypothetical protein